MSEFYRLIDVDKDNKELRKQLDYYKRKSKRLQQENQPLIEEINKLQEELNEENLQCSKYAIELNDQKEKNKQLKDNWDKLKEYFNERIEVCDNRLSSPFCNFEKTTKERLIFSQCLEKLEELEQGSDSNVKD